MKINEKNTYKAAGGFALATDFANYLAEKGLPFRQAHHIVGAIVAYLVSENRDFESITLEELKKFSNMFDEDVLRLLKPEVVADRRNSFGGTSKQQILAQIKYWEEILNRKD